MLENLFDVVTVDSLNCRKVCSGVGHGLAATFKGIKRHTRTIALRPALVDSFGKGYSTVQQPFTDHYRHMSNMV